MTTLFYVDHLLTSFDHGMKKCSPEKLAIFNHVYWGYPLVICYIAIENDPFIVDLPIKDGDFL